MLNAAKRGRGRGHGSPSSEKDGDVAQRHRRRGIAAAPKRNSVTWRCGAYPGLLVPQLDSGRSCDEAKGVREVGNPPAARNCLEVGSPAAEVQVEIRALQAGGRGQQARGRSWARGGPPAVVGRGWEAVAWPVRGGAEARRGKAARRQRLGLEVGVGWRMGKSRGADVVKKGEAEIWSCVPQKELAGDLGGDAARRYRQGRRS